MTAATDCSKQTFNNKMRTHIAKTFGDMGAF